MKTSTGLPAMGLALLCMSPQVFGEDASDPSDSLETTRTEVNGIPAIVVTAKHYVPEASISANKSDIPLIETPQSVSVITRDQIDLLNFVDSQQAVRYAAGVEGENYGPDLRYDFLTVRGFTPKQYIDGLAAPISTTIYSVGLDLYGFQSFDILKGPASVLYGNAPPGGIYDQISRRASNVASGELGIKYGSYNFKEVGDVSRSRCGTRPRQLETIFCGAHTHLEDRCQYQPDRVILLSTRRSRR
jgi:iron complex outermembrane receptor protein